MEDGRVKGDLWGSNGISSREGQGKRKSHTVVERRFGTFNGGTPREQVVLLWKGGNVRDRISHEGEKLAIETLRHSARHGEFQKTESSWRRERIVETLVTLMLTGFRMRLVGLRVEWSRWVDPWRRMYAV